jgi:U6 snRNA-associated Sm-like protein LSm4
MVELRNGETYNGHLAEIDFLMNIVIRDVIRTSRSGDQFTRIAEVYIRGSTVKYLRIPDEVIEKVQEDAQSFAGFERGRGRGRGRGDFRGGRGRGRGRGGFNGGEGAPAATGDASEQGRGGFRGGRGGARGGSFVPCQCCVLFALVFY